MEAMAWKRSEYEAQRAEATRQELAERIAWAVREDGVAEPLPWLRLRRADAPTELGHGVSAPSFCVIAQGSKEILLGEKRYRYDPAHYLITTASLPIASRISEASREQPFLNMVFHLDVPQISAVMAEAGHMLERGCPAVTAIDVSALDMGLLDAAARLMRLLENPTESRLLAPLVLREILYRLLMGEQRERLGQIVAQGGAGQRIAAVVDRLRREFDQPLRIDELARDHGMSVSGFHHHFRAFTAMSPLQFQKQLRLQEARRLMLSEGLDAASAGFRVGYSNASHFTREYKRLFGAPPLRDVEHLRDASGQRAVAQGAV
ncbi:AraC family transcriptional regulator [Chloroflexia bacterium SDU3-3]|nr:AraC family transcriptional regulator [Chloroflexia bacterium SDU3-3]